MLVFETAVMVFCFAILIIMIGFILKSAFNKRNYYYSSPFENTKEILIRIKKQNKKLYEELQNEDTLNKFLSIRINEFADVFDFNKSNKKFGIENYRKLSQEINVFLLYLNCYKELVGKESFINYIIKKFTDNINVVKEYILDNLTKNPNSETFYLQKTLLNYFEDFFKFSEIIKK